MKKIIFAIILSALLLTSCNTLKTKGGSASQTITGPTGVPAVAQAMTQPDNPDSPATQTIERETTTTTPDGTTTTVKEKAATKVGGAQDLAEILKAADKQQVGGVLLGLILLWCAYVALRKEWPTTAGVLALGALASMMISFWWGLAAFAAAVLIRYSWSAAELYTLRTISPK